MRGRKSYDDQFDCDLFDGYQSMPELRKRVTRRRRASSPVVATETAAVAAAVGTKKKTVKRKTQGAGPVVVNNIRTRAAVARAKAEAKAAEEAAKEAEVKEGLEGKEKNQQKEEEEEEEKVVPVAEDKEEKMADKNGGLSAKGSAGQDDDGNAAPFPDKVTVKTQCFLREFMFVSVGRFGV